LRGRAPSSPPPFRRLCSHQWGTNRLLDTSQAGSVSSAATPIRLAMRRDKLSLSLSLSLSASVAMIYVLHAASPATLCLRQGRMDSGGPGPKPPTNRGPPTKPFIFYFSLYDRCLRDYTTHYLVVAHCWSLFYTIIFNFVTYYTVSQKKQDAKLLPITSPNINRFSKFFYC